VNQPQYVVSAQCFSYAHESPPAKLYQRTFIQRRLLALRDAARGTGRGFKWLKRSEFSVVSSVADLPE
jgi:hypothetical protein